MPVLDCSITPPRYPLAVQDRLRGDLAGLTGEDRAAATIVWAKRLRMLSYAYRPVPQALRFHRSQARWRFLLGGNRSSKSYSLAMETLWAATGSHPWRHYETPNQGVYATTTWDKVGDTLWAPKLEKLLLGIRHETVWHNKQRNIPEMVFVQPKGILARKFWSQITFKAYEQGRESFQAVALRYVHNDEQFPQDIWIEQNSRIGSEYRLDLASAFTPIEPQPWLEQALTTSIPAGWEVFELPLDDNRVSRGGFIADEQIDAMIEQWPPEVRDTRRNGKWGSFLGSIFQSFSLSTHVVSEERERELFFKGERVNPNCRVVGGIDWGGNNPFVFLWATRIPHLDDDWYIFDCYYWNAAARGIRRLEQHAAEIKERTARWGTTLERVWADHDPTDANEMAYMGVPSMPADKSDGSVKAGIELMWALLHPREKLSNAYWPEGRPRLHIAARCVDLIREMPLYKWDKNKERPLKQEDHGIDALRMILFSEAPLQTMPMVVDLGAENRRIF